MPFGVAIADQPKIANNFSTVQLRGMDVITGNYGQPYKVRQHFRRMAPSSGENQLPPFLTDQKSKITS